MLLQFILFLFCTPLNGFPSPSSSFESKSEVDEDELVGMGLGLKPFGSPGSSLLRNAAKAQALALKAHADFYKQIAAANLKRNMALAKVRTASLGYGLPFKKNLLGSEQKIKREHFSGLKNLDFNNDGLDDFDGLDFNQLEGMDFDNDDFDLIFDELKRNGYGLKTKHGDLDEDESLNEFDFTESNEDSDLFLRRNKNKEDFHIAPRKPIIVNPSYGLNKADFFDINSKTSKYLDEEEDDDKFSTKNHRGDIFTNKKKAGSGNIADYLPSKLPHYLVNKRQAEDQFSNEESRKSNHHHNGNMHRDEELFVWSLNWQNNLERSNDEINPNGKYIPEKIEKSNQFLEINDPASEARLFEDSKINNHESIEKSKTTNSFRITESNPNSQSNADVSDNFFTKRSINQPLSFNLFRNNPLNNEDRILRNNVENKLAKANNSTLENKLQSCDNELGCYLIEISGPQEFWDTHIINDNVKLEGFQKVPFPRKEEISNQKNTTYQKPAEIKNNSTKLREANTDPRHFHQYHFPHKLFNDKHKPIHFWGLKPTQVTINNQQNTFTNTNAGGNIQIAQTTGNSATSQAASKRNSRDQILESPQLLQFPYNRRAYKRSLPLIKLIADPNAKLDMPKTIENVGTIARNSFEDKRAPMYHIKNMVGSVKNAFLSTLKIAPQDLIIPSQYKIIDKKEAELLSTPLPIVERNNKIVKENVVEQNRPLSLREKLEKFRLEREKRLNIPKINEVLLKKAAFNKPSISSRRNNIQVPNRNEIVGSSNVDGIKEDPFNFLGTFQKLGTIIRDSVNSGKETLNHVTDAAQSARKVLHTSRFAAPRVLLPYRRAPVLQKPEKVMMITPRFLDVARDDHKNQESRDFVGVAHIMDAFGLSNPTNDEINFRKTTIHRGSGPKLMSRFGDENDSGDSVVNDKLYIVSEDLGQNDVERKFVDDAWSSLQKIKEIVGVNTIGEFLDTMEKEFSSIRDKHERSASTPRLRSRFGETNKQELDEFLKGLFLEKKEEEWVGIGLNLAPDLLKPFMNQPSNDELTEYLEENGDSIEEQDFFKKDDDSLLLSSHANSSFIGENDNLKANQEGTNEDSRTSMHFHKSLLKPYLGKIDVSEEYDYYHPYGNYMDDSYERK